MRGSRARRKGTEAWRQCWGKWAVGRASRRWLSANSSRECSLTDVGVAGDLAKDVSLSACSFLHLLQLLRTQSLSCHLHNLHSELMPSSSMNTTADHRAHSSARVRQHPSHGLLLSHLQEWSLSIWIPTHQTLKTHPDNNATRVELTLASCSFTAASASNLGTHKVQYEAQRKGRGFLDSNPVCNTLHG